MSGRIKVLVVTGSSGGHIFPALAFLYGLKERRSDADTLLVLPRKNTAGRIDAVDYSIRYINVLPIGLRLDLDNFSAIAGFIKSSLESIGMLIRFSPDLVVGFGSLASLPLLFFAWLFRIPTMIHEQNVIPGRANKALSFFVDRIAISFAETKHYLNSNLLKKVSVTGNPLRRDLKKIDKDKALDFFGFTSARPVILVMGGSAGSHSININFLKALSLIRDRADFQVIHISGESDYDMLRDKYKELNISVKLCAFLKEMPYAYSACDVMISRGGATTIAEAMYFAVPAIIIPYPFAYKHQSSNAAVLEKGGCAVIIKDGELNPEALKERMLNLIENHDKMKDMRLRYNNIRNKENASNLMVDEALSLLKGHS